MLKSDSFHHQVALTDKSDSGAIPIQKDNAPFAALNQRAFLQGRHPFRLKNEQTTCSLRS